MVRFCGLWWSPADDSFLRARGLERHCRHSLGAGRDRWQSIPVFTISRPVLRPVVGSETFSDCQGYSGDEAFSEAIAAVTLNMIALTVATRGTVGFPDVPNEDIIPRLPHF